VNQWSNDKKSGKKSVFDSELCVISRYTGVYIRFTGQECIYKVYWSGVYIRFTGQEYI